MEIVFGDVVTGVHGDGFEYLCSWQAGGPVSFNVGGREWLYRAPRPALWRATTDNDRGNGFPVKSAMWMGADMFATCSKIELSVDGEPVDKPLAPDNNSYGGPVQAQTIQKTMADILLLQQAEKLVQPKEETPEDELAVEDTAYFQMRQRISDLLSQLDEKDAQILTMRFGLDKGLPVSAEEVGRTLGLTVGEVSEREAAALAKLRADQ